MTQDSGTEVVPATPRVGRPASVTAAAIAMVTAAVGVVMWTAWVIADVTRLAREAGTMTDRFDGSEGPTFYTLYSLICTAVAIGFALVTAGASGWLLRRGKRVSLTITCFLLAGTAVIAGLPAVFTAGVVALTGTDRQVTPDMSFDEALTVLHTANEPTWSPAVAVLASTFILAGSLGAIVLLLVRGSRRYFAQR